MGCMTSSPKAEAAATALPGDDTDNVGKSTINKASRRDSVAVHKKHLAKEKTADQSAPDSMVERIDWGRQSKSPVQSTPNNHIHWLKKEEEAEKFNTPPVFFFPSPFFSTARQFFIFFPDQKRTGKRENLRIISFLNSHVCWVRTLSEQVS